ncbi:MAG: N-acetyl sugar amidotransferase [Flavobacterium sp.]|jgi:N-acetyl sugar amidotransferase
MVVQCQRCLYTSDHPLGITFDADYVCSGCRIHEEKDSLDWSARWQELEILVSKYRTPGAKYDCIVPVSGARDSFFVLDMVVNKLNLKPLVVGYNKYFNTPAGIANLAQLRLAFDVDFQLKNVDPRIVKKITRKSLYAYGNPYWHCLAGETVFPVQTAAMMKIPLIIWGAHQGLEQVGMFSHLHNVEMSRRYRKDHDLFGVDADNLVGDFDDLSEDDTINYKYPAFSDIESVGIRGIYLGNYIRWDPYAQHLKMVSDFGFRGSALTRTFDAFDHADCYVYSNLHDVLKMYKHGYSKVTDQVCREIRFGRLTRDLGKQIVCHYENQPPMHMNLFCKWLGVDERSLQFAANRHRNKKHWDEVEPDVWVRRKQSMVVPKIAPQHSNLVYTLGSDEINDEDTRGYITIGKGVNWPSRPSATVKANWL